MTGPSGFDDPRDTDAAQLWLGLAGIPGVEPVPEPESTPEPQEDLSTRPATARRGRRADPAVGTPAPDLDSLLTRASDLPSPAPSSGGVTPLPWTTTGREPAGPARRPRGRRAGTSPVRGGTATGRDAVSVDPAPEGAAVVGRSVTESDTATSSAPRRRRPGPAPLPEEPRAREEAAREVVLRQLAMGPRSRGQLERKLAEREAEPELIAAVLDRFEEVRLVDDAAFAEVWVRSRHRGKGLSRRAIGQELRQKGVDREVAAEALEAIDPEDEHAAALDLVRRRLRGRPAPPRPDTPEQRAERDKAVRRLVGMLGRKGYGPGLAFRVVNEALDEL